MNHPGETSPRTNLHPPQSRLKRRLRFGAFASGAIFFLWLPFEDTSLTWLLALSLAVSTLLATSILLTRKAAAWSGYCLAGCLGGLAVTPIALLLMTLKTSLHAHLSPDFSIEQISLLLMTTPVWILVGALVGCGIGVFNRGQHA